MAHSEKLGERSHSTGDVCTNIGAVVLGLAIGVEVLS